MKIIKPNAVELKQTDLFKHIELCGRTCYKSEDRITDDSSEKFVNMLRSHAHGAMLEHGTVYMIIDKDNLHNVESPMESGLEQFVLYNKYTTFKFDKNTYYITTNYRAIVENNLEWAMNIFACEPTEHHVKRRTFKITCNRGVSHEFVRHRVFSFAQESQRYCNYSKDKFDSEIKVIEPEALSFGKNVDSVEYALWKKSCETAEKSYLYLLRFGATPQEARDVLPNSCATEFIMTGFESDWEHFFNLRCAKDAHPQAQEVANMIKEIF